MARSRLIRILIAWLIGCAAMAGAARAHQAPNSEAHLDLYADRLELNLVIPAAEYAYASGNRTTGDEASRALAQRYLESTLFVRDAAGPWQSRVDRLDFVNSNGDRDLVASLSFRPPSPRELRRFTLGWRAIIGAVPDHFVLVMLRRDPARKLGDEPDVIGTLHGDRTELAIDRGAARAWMPFAHAVGLGARHILEGIDHLAFLLALMLPLPLAARGARWHAAHGQRSTIRAAAILISGFTVGHSATLIAASLGGLTLPGALVETLIAVSVLIAAIHAIRPVFPRREALIATLIGLVHGLGFAGFLSSADLSIARNVVTLLGFNIGIELVQISIALTVVPALASLASSPAYAKIRSAIAVFCCCIAAVWVADRYFGLDESVVAPFETSVGVTLMLTLFALPAAAVGLSAHRVLVSVRRTG